MGSKRIFSSVAKRNRRVSAPDVLAGRFDAPRRTHNARTTTGLGWVPAVASGVDVEAEEGYERGCWLRRGGLRVPWEKGERL